MKLGWQRGWGGNRTSLPYLVFILSIAATVCAWVWAGMIIGGQDRDRFAYATEEAEQSIKGRIDDEVDLLKTSAAAFTIQGGWSRSQFRTYVANLGLSTNFQGSQGLGFIKRVRESQVPELEQALIKQGAKGFKVHPIPSEQEVYPIIYLEPETETNQPSVGFNPFSEPVRREAMTVARDTGQTTMSGVITSGPGVTPQRSQGGFVLYCPIYEGGENPDSVVERRRLLIGFVYIRFRGIDIFRNVLEGEARKDLDIEISDVPDGGPETRFYASSRQTVHRESRIVFDGYIPVQGRRWKVRYHSSLGFEQQSAAWLVNWIPIAGFMVSLLLAAVSLSQVRAYGQLGNQAATLIRREADQRLLAEIGATLVDSGATEQNLRAVAGLVIAEIADWFSIVVSEGNRSRITRVSEVDDRCQFPEDPGTCLDEGVLLEWLLEQRSVVQIESVSRSEPALKPLRKLGVRSIVVVPILSRSGVLMSMIAGRTGKSFEPDDVQVLEQIAARTSVALESVRLFEEKQRELEERTKAEAQIRRLNENLEHIVDERTTELKATNQELEAFCYSVSHDLRAPLRSVDGFSQSLLEDYGEQLDDQAKDYIGRVRKASHRMDELISALLNLSRITRLELARQTVDLTQMAWLTVEDTLEGKDKSQYTVDVQPGMVVEADPKLARVVLDNLVRNAVKFSQRSLPARIEIGHNGSAFYVRDHGVGFNPAYAEKLFVAFERLHTQSEFPGSGIGLATVQRIVQKHGGKVWAESEVGKGATFFFTLEIAARD